MIERDLTLEELKPQLMRAQTVMKKGVDLKRREMKYKEEDLVYLKLRSYCQKSLAAHAKEKLAVRYYSPFEIEEEVGPVAYKLILLPHCPIHPIFHVSQLQEARGALKANVEIPRQLNEDLEMLVEPEAVLGVRPRTGKNLQGLKVLIQ